METAQSAHSHCVLDPACGARENFEVVSGRWGTLQPLLEAVCQWSERHLGEVEEARLAAKVRNLN